MSSKVKFELQLNPVGSMSAAARLWVDSSNDGYLHKKDEEVTLLTQDGKKWVGESTIDSNEPSGTLFHLRFISTPGTKWSFRVTHGDKELWREDKETSMRRTIYGGSL